MIEQIALVLGIAVVDSINPSALIVTFFLLTQPRFATKILIYVSAIFLTYFLLGLALMLGLSVVGTALQSPFAYGLTGVLGLVLFIYAWIPRKPKTSHPNQRVRGQHPAALFGLGITVTVLELPTALPYLGAISILTTYKWAVEQWLPILALYNLIFVLPPLVLMLVYRTLGNRLEPAALERWKERLQGGAQETLSWIFGILGFVLVSDSLAYFKFFGLMP